MKERAYEVNFDGIVGPTHNYSGLSYGNIASSNHQLQISNPREAALQGLNKMRFLMDLGIKQAVLPPQERPHLPTLRAVGYKGTDQAILQQVHKNDPELLTAVTSAASMWAANAATITPSVDSSDHKVHFTPANLSNKFHRSIETSTTAAVLRRIFADHRHFVHHPALPAGSYFSDEGAANHTRFCQTYEKPGIQLFHFGRHSLQESDHLPSKFPARQTYEASQAIARLHQLSSNHTIFTQQNPLAIDAGAFHNDVVSVGNTNVFLYHQDAFLNKDKLIEEIQQKVLKTCRCEMVFLEVKRTDITLKEAIQTYLFNSQLITLPQGGSALIAPSECEHNPHISQYIRNVLSPYFAQIHYLDLHQSMNNGGGPACLRLRVVLNEQELAATLPSVFLNEALYHTLVVWVNKHYRDRLHPDDLGDFEFFRETQTALDELKQLLKLE